jgi:quercetin dioxygenase-like cupin family protein
MTIALALFLAACASAPIRQTAAPVLPPGAIQYPVNSLQWKAAPPSLPKGSEVAILEGDPKKEGMFTMRIKLPAGSIIPPHWHPRDERVTVISGALRVGIGDVIDEKTTTRFEAGSFYLNPPELHHYLLIDRDSVLQLTCMGPWELRLVEAK